MNFATRFKTFDLTRVFPVWIEPERSSSSTYFVVLSEGKTGVHFREKALHGASSRFFDPAPAPHFPAKLTRHSVPLPSSVNSSAPSGA